MRKTKRMFSIILSFLLVLSMTPMSAFADSPQAEIIVSPSIGEMDKTSGETDIEYTISFKHLGTDAGSIEFTLAPDAALTISDVVLPANDGTFFDLDYTEITKKFTGAKNDGKAYTADSLLLTVKAKIAAGTTGTVKLNLSGVSIGDKTGEVELTFTTTINSTVINEVIDSTQIISITAPVKGATPQSAVSDSTGYTGGLIAWDPSAAKFAANTPYTASATLTAKAGYKFASGTTVSVAGFDDTIDNNPNVTVAADGSTLHFTVTFPATANKDPLTGIPTIDGTTKVGEVLTAKVDTLNDKTNITYQWYRGTEAISGATSASYTLSPVDADKKIKIVVTATDASDYSGSVESAETANIANASQTAPTLAESAITKTHNSITVTENIDWEYSKDGGSSWQVENVFTGLKANTSYNICVRLKAKTGYDASSASSVLNITTEKAPGSIIINEPGTITYDSAAVEAGTSGKDLNYTYVGDATPDVKWYGAEADGSRSDTPLSGAPKDAGTYWIGVSAPAGSNYNAVSEVFKQFTIDKKTLTVTAKPKTITYGDAPTNDGVQYAGFAGSENESVLGGTLAYDYTYVQYDDVGSSYKITPKGLTASNYDISYVAGDLTVERKEVSLVWDGTTGLKHGDTVNVTATVTGTVNGDVVNVLVYNGTNNTVGNYMATATDLTGEKANNYKLPVSPTKNYSVGKADAATGVQAEKKVLYSVSGKQTITISDFNIPANIENPALASETSNPSTNLSDIIGSYDETGFTLKSGLNSSDKGKTATWDVKITSDSHEDITATVKVTIDDKIPVTISGLTYDNKEYDGTVVTPTGTLTISNGLTKSDLDVKYEKWNGSSWDTIAALSANAGQYKVTYSVKDTNENYMGSKPYEFEITQKVLTKPTLSGTYAYTGAEQDAVLTGFDANTMNVSGNAKKDAGNTNITVSLKDTINYKWSDGTADVTIPWDMAKAELKVKPKNITITKGNALPTAIEVEYVGLKGTDEGATVATLASGDLTAFEIRNADDSDVLADSNTAGTYKIKFAGSPVFSTATNYDIAVEDGTLTIKNPSSGGGGYLPPAQNPTITSGEGVKVTLSADGTVATIKVDAGYELVDVLLNGVSKGKVTEIKGLKTGDKLEVKTEKKPAEPTTEEIIATLADHKLAARSKVVTMKNGKKAVRITWYNQNGEMMEFDGVEIFRSTKKNSGYGKKPFFATKGESKGYYVNSKDVKVGTTYYYKVRGYVVIDGQKYYTDYSLKAIRTVK